MRLSLPRYRCAEDGTRTRTLRGASKHARDGHQRTAGTAPEGRGKWFPDIRKGSREQVQAYKDAHKALFRNTRYESKLRTADGKRAIRDETPRYADLNDRAARSAAPLSRTQQRWHWQRALGSEDRDFGRLQDASDRQARPARSSR